MFLGALVRTAAEGKPARDAKESNTINDARSAVEVDLLALQKVFDFRVVTVAADGQRGGAGGEERGDGHNGEARPQ